MRGPPGQLPHVGPQRVAFALVFLGAGRLIEIDLQGGETPPGIFQGLAQPPAELLLRLLRPAVCPLLLAHRPYPGTNRVKRLVGPLQPARLKGGNTKPARLLPHVAAARRRAGVRLGGRGP